LKFLKILSIGLLFVGFSANAETDNFNISLTGTFDNTVPDACSVAPIPTVNLGTINTDDLQLNPFILTPQMLHTQAHDTGVTVDIIVNCTTGTNYEFTLDQMTNVDAITGALFYLVSGGNFIGDTEGGSKITGTGNGVDQTYTVKVYIGSDLMVTPLAILTGSPSATLPATLTVL